MMTTLRWRAWWELSLTAILSLIFGLTGLTSLIVDTIRKGPSRMFCVRRRRVRPQVLDNEEFGTHHFLTLKDGHVKLHYVINGPPDKPLIVLSHGFPEFWYSWRHQLKELSTNYRVVAYDLRGYGESYGPLDVAGYTFDQMADDLEQLITALGYERCVVVGHDWGGAAAFSLAAIYPHRVERLIILNAPHPLAFMSYLRRSFSQLLKARHMFLYQLPLLSRLILNADDFKYVEDAFCSGSLGARHGTFTPEDIEAFKYPIDTYGFWSSSLRVFHAAFRYTSPKFDGAVARGNIISPTLIIWGTRDGALNTELAELSSRHLHQSTIRYIEGASHWVHQEQPQQVNELIQQFISDQLMP